MKKTIIGIVFLIIIIGILILPKIFKEKIINNQLNARVITINDDKITLQDNNNIIYTIETNDLTVNVGDKLIIEYDKKLNKNMENQEINIINYQINNTDNNYQDWQDNGIFKEYYDKAYQTLQTMSINEKINQLFLVRIPKENANNILKQNQFGGYLFFEKDFKNKTKKEVQDMINTFQDISKIPLLTAIDEEGGKVSRLNKNSNLVETPFKSPQELYQEGGFNLIKEDTINKSKILEELGLNLNLAPVVDISTNEEDYIYSRTLGENYLLTSQYAKTVIEASKNINVSYTLKHFPGYGSNKDTHLDISIDNRDYNSLLQEDLIPFKEGINSGAEAIMISHNTVNAIDSTNPASLSPSIHNLLRNELKFTGIIITDDLYMGAVSNTLNSTLKALIAGNDLIITTNYEKSFNEIKEALNNKIINEDLINKAAFRIIAWKYYKGLIK